MMGIQEMLVALMLTLFGDSSGNELLDYVDADLYFETKGIEISVDTMLLEAQKPATNENSYAKEASVRRLLAIRTLGELKNQKAIATLSNYVKSEEFFVSEYAIQAIASIKNKEIEKENLSKLQTNLSLLPKDTGVVTQLTLSPKKGKRGLLEKFNALKKMDGAEDVLPEVRESFTTSFYPFIEKLGNIRIDSITTALSDHINEDSGWITMIVNGQFDKQAIHDFINQEMADKVDLKKINSAIYFTTEDTMAFSLQDNNTLIFSTAPTEELMPLSSLQKAINGKKQAVSFSEKLQNLIKQTKQDGILTISGIVSGEMLNLPFIKEFNTFKLETQLRENNITASLTAEANNAEIVKQTTDELKKLYTNFLENDLAVNKEHLPPSMKPMIKAYESLDFQTNGKQMIITLELPRVDPIELIFEAFNTNNKDF